MADQRQPEFDQHSARAWWAAAGQHFQAGKWSEAAQALRKAIQFDSATAALWSDLGVAEQYRGDLDAARTAYEASLRLAPSNPQTLANLGFLLVQQGQAVRALEILKPLLTTADTTAQLQTAAGHAYRAVGDNPSAVIAFRRAVELEPGDIEARQNLATALLADSRLSEAKEATRVMLAANPNLAEGWHLLGQIEQGLGNPGEAIAAFRRSVELKPNSASHSSLLLALQYIEEIEPHTLLAAHRQWDAAYAGSVPAVSHPAVRDPGRKLRIGFVSSQFGEHPIGFLSLRAVECLDKTRCTITCYSGRSHEDEYTARFKAASDGWRPTAHLSAAELAMQIRDDEIDILIDLMGHTSSALLAFAHHPAVLQVTWLGYVGTTGLSAMDCLLADSYHVRPGEEGLYTEEILRMPHGYACFGPPANVPPVGELPALKSGRVTFGCFNNPAKYSPRMLRAWADILRRIPNSQLQLRYFGLDDRCLQDRLLATFSAAGITSERVIFAGAASHFEMLAAYGQIDLALDTQPYSGGLTTCEALWMGVPVITFPGQTFAGRHSTSHLVNSGLAQFVSRDQASYIDLAVAWVSRLDELSSLRAQMREQVRRSPLCNAEAFAKDFLDVMQGAWQSRVDALAR